MIASQNVMITDVMMHIASIGGGGLMPPPTTVKWTTATIAPTTSAISVSRIPFVGWEHVAAKLGCLQPQVTDATISMGMKQIVRKATQVANIGKANSEIKPNETAITSAVATTPSSGCFTLAPCWGHPQVMACFVPPS